MKIDFHVNVIPDEWAIPLYFSFTDGRKWKNASIICIGFFCLFFVWNLR